jgi:hypothetical protein
MSAACPMLGFMIDVVLSAGATETANEIRKDLVTHLEPHGLSVADAGTARYTITRDGSQATHADRELVMLWTERWTSVAEVHVSDLVDLSAAP